jgi:hypothetical protein
MAMTMTMTVTMTMTEKQDTCPLLKILQLITVGSSDLSQAEKINNVGTS